MNKKVEEKCQELLNEARKEGISKSALSLLVSKNLLKPKSKKTDKPERKVSTKGKNKKDLKYNKEEDNMSGRMIEEKIEKLNEEAMKVVADIQDYYNEEMKKLKETITKEILSAKTEEEKKQIIERFQHEESRIKAKEISERQNVGNKVMQIIMTI